MSGHSKWAGIKHKKALVDAKRGKLFSKLIREITVTARNGGGNQNINPQLRLAVNKAKEANMPSDNIERAIKKGTGELPGVSYEEIIYEGYGPGGVAIMVETLSDNKNRTTAEIRNIFSKKSGNLAGAGSVSWMFHKKGFITIDKDKIDEDKLMSIVLESGAEDLATQETNYEITTSVQDFEKVKNALKENNVEPDVASLTMVPNSYIKLDGSQARAVLSLLEILEDHDDAQNVYANFDIPDEIIAQVAEGK